MEQEPPSLLQSYKLQGKQSFVSDFSCLLRHAIEVLFYTVKKKNVTPRGSSYHKDSILYQTIPALKDLEKQTYLKIMGKGENAGKYHFSFSHDICCLQLLSNLDPSKNFVIW